MFRSAKIAKNFSLSRFARSQFSKQSLSIARKTAHFSRETAPYTPVWAPFHLIISQIQGYVQQELSHLRCELRRKLFVMFPGTKN